MVAYSIPLGVTTLQNWGWYVIHYCELNMLKDDKLPILVNIVLWVNRDPLSMVYLKNVL